MANAKVTNERAQAISVANCYFALADGMVPGFKDHLAEHVVLKWFGQVIKGKKNVAAFMLSNKKESFHTFSDIMPILDISRKRTNWKTKQSLDQNANCTSDYFREAHSSHETEMSTTHENVENCYQKNKATYAAFIYKAAYNENEFCIEKCIDKLGISADCDNVNVNFDVNQNEFSANAIAEMGDQCYDLDENDLRNLFEPEITSQPIVGKIQNINRIKLKEEMAPTVRAINRECGQGDGPVTAEAKATKYLEANGEIKFVRISAETDSPFLYHWSKLWKKKVWKRPCKLQIVYSLLIDNASPTVATKCCGARETARSDHVSNLSSKVYHNTDKIQTSKLPSLEEAIQASNALIRDVNHFGGYLQPLNFSEDRKIFLKSFEAEVAQKNPKVHVCAHYVNNKLIFDFPSKRSFNVMYKIHKIIYMDVEENV
ncbi:uncharacterized protein LOC143900938 isoform X1 [Temnothorax americanus]|uniref:uncharacterized protein LOC143900938 isoform X1 n=1 Tax=Temnothorax americanus TaxID=1964332 RepID=UPI004068C09F